LSSSKVIALDIGGTHTRAALFDGPNIVWRAAAPTPGQGGPEAMLARMLSLLAPVRGEDARCGVAIAGQVVDGCVTAHNASILRGWQAFPLQQAMAQSLQRRVRVVNDARAAAWAEYLHGTGRGCGEFLFLTVSTGIGAGLVLDGRLHLARNGLDAELGDTLLADGCTLESLAGGAGLAAWARQHGHIDGKALCDAADAGDAGAEAHLRRGIRELACKLADLTVMLGIQRSAIGGGLGLRAGYLERLREELHRLPALYHHEMMRAELGSEAGLHGAAALARDA
jgi:N-acylmannosamine kinase